jgi:hypothetical protein
VRVRDTPLHPGREYGAGVGSSAAGIGETVAFRIDPGLEKAPPTIFPTHLHPMSSRPTTAVKRSPHGRGCFASPTPHRTIAASSC